MRVAFVQFAPAFGARVENIGRALELAEGAPADLYVLPELFTTGYCFQSREELASLAEPVIGGFTVGHLQVWCRRHNAFVCGGLAEADGPRLYNSAVLVGPRGLVNVYRKAHLFWREQDIFDRATEDPFEVANIGPARVGMMICFDWIFPEAARVLALRGAQIILHPAALVLRYCPPAMVTRAVENRVFTVTAGRTGEESRWDRPLRFIGASRVVSPAGDVLAEAGEEEVAKAVEIEPAAADDKKITPANDIVADRRAEFYEDLLK